MQQKVILHSEQVSRKGEIKYFQIPLQGIAMKIIAVEVSAFLFSESPAVASSLKVETVSTETPTHTNTPSPVTNTCPNPGRASIDALSNTDTGVGGIRTQVFRIGAAVNPTFVYSCGVYSVTVSVTAVDGDTPASIAAKLAAEVNNTSLATWSQYGSNNRNYKPTASSDGETFTLTVDYQHSFFASGSGECTGIKPPDPVLPPQLLAYDPLFTIVNHERAGVLSLQSPDATDIFYQCEAWRQDKNINYGDFSFPDDVQGEWLKGRKRNANEVAIATASPILEAYYKDSWGVYYNKDVSYGLNIFIWYEKA